MDMNRAFNLRKEDRNPRWILLDAEGQVLGRLATKIADIVRGKNQAHFTPHTDSGDYVVVINAEKIVLTGDKLNGKIYDSYSGYMGGYKTKTAREMLERKPEELIRLAVKRMLPKSRLGRSSFKKLRVYAGNEHPHSAQVA